MSNSDANELYGIIDDLLITFAFKENTIPPQNDYFCVRAALRALAQARNRDPDLPLTVALANYLRDIQLIS